MRTPALLATAMLALTLTACGGDDQADPADGNTPGDEQQATQEWTEQQIVDHLGLTETESGSYMYGDCQVPVVMTTQQAVDMYADAGDTVATTPDGHAGVKIVGDCESEIAAELENIG